MATFSWADRKFLKTDKSIKFWLEITNISNSDASTLLKILYWDFLENRVKYPYYLKVLQLFKSASS